MTGPASPTRSDPGAAAPDATATALLQEDMARMFRLIGVQSVHASVVDLAARVFQAGWSISDDGSVVESLRDRGLDSVFPGAAGTLDQLTQVSVERTLLQKLSPRRWVCAWRIDAARAILAEAHYRDRVDVVNDMDAAVLRMICNTSIRHSLAASAAAASQPGAADSAPVMVWPQVERRAPRPPPRIVLLLSGLLLAATLFIAGVALVAAPGARQTVGEQQAENAQLRKTIDATLVQRLSTAMATGDYGEAQADLSSFSSLGYFQRAVVTNAKGKVVAMAGQASGLRIGDTLDPAFAAAARKLDLMLGSVPQGQLFLITVTAPAAAALVGLRVTAGLALAAALAAAATLALLLRRRWH